ncbi:MAG: hypothetical protein ACLGIK_10730 [Gemmatimonadota bacterium]
MRARHGTLAESRLVPVDSAGRYVNERIVMQSSSGLRAEMLMRRPGVTPAATAATPPTDKAARPRGAARRAVFIILGGHTSQERAATLIEDPGDNIVVALAYPFDGNPRVKGLAVVPLVPRIRKALLDTPPAVMLAIDYLRARPDVDTTRIELVGASFGAPFAAMTAALDTRVSRLWLVHGAGETYTLLEHNLVRNIPWRVPRVMVAALANVLAAGPRFAPERWVPLVSPRPVIMINATEDERLPRPAIELLHNSAREPKEVIWLPGMHIRSNRKAIIEGLVKIVLERSAMPARAGS